MPVALRCLFAWLLLAPSAGASEPPRIVLGLVAPPSESDAASLLRGAQLAVAEANETGQPTVGLEVQGENGQWGTAGNEAVNLVFERHVDAIIAPSDGPTNHLILQVSGRTQVPVASLCSDSSVTNAGVPWVVRVVPRTDQEAEALFSAERRPGRSPIHWWAMIPIGRSGRSILRDLETAAHKSAAHLDQVLEAGESRAALAPQVHSIVSSAPGGVLVWLPPSQAGTVVAALRASGYGGLLAGASPIDSPEFAAAAGAAASGVWAAGFRADLDSLARAERFRRQFQRQYGVFPDSSAAAAFDASRVLIETLRGAQKGAGDRQFPITLPIYGVTGILRFDKSGNRTGELQVLTFQEGRFIPLPHSDPQP
jgi:ABC-type branched-subunit amino acid transport system substrate-binding protein